MPKRFTLIRAERLLPEIEVAIREAVSFKAEYQEAEQGATVLRAATLAMQGGIMIDRQALIDRRSARDRLATSLKAAIEKDSGVRLLHLRDLDIGLIDFPTRFPGREVYLCWKLGESGIRVLGTARMKASRGARKSIAIF